MEPIRNAVCMRYKYIPDDVKMSEKEYNTYQFVQKTVKELHTDKNRLVCCDGELEVSDKHIVMQIHGGCNGNGKWTDYVDVIKKLVENISERHECWIVQLINDCIDDTWFVDLGIAIDEICSNDIAEVTRYQTSDGMEWPSLESAQEHDKLRKEASEKASKYIDEFNDLKERFTKELKEYPEFKYPGFMSDGLQTTTAVPDYCTNCRNNPKNNPFASGICHCILGSRVIY